ncbi:DUF1206 domain-containing protein [Paracoccus sp. 1_MG-2023]|uniref:DUF1206 domain-containing protein n=1 Tax=unclassified Paracoccus (in: a-proteobacteria) TaxID=2688777 RepID=UPI001C09FBA8|nr:MULTISPECIES: DUF1206 domain-containing protein [unclassified Paracoccus (in: a-proteobacteria)]MBU2957856.1 DUF1206 domain-containing protein [Paracoccus sp. C2R09]MDO6667296.1 DUF1206 domain-containing protein [Paracoccus sp. 1_MG-2023]
MGKEELKWAVPLMRAGYTGKGLVYAVVAGMSLYSIWRGGQAQDTSSAFGWVENSLGGGILLAIIAAGMFAYALWRVLDAWFDLEAYGSEAKGIVARIGMVVTGAIHLGIGILAVSLIIGSGGSGQGSGISGHVGTVMGWPGGRWIIGLVALLILGAGGHYMRQGLTNEYRKHLRANHFTTRWNPILKAGLIAHGIVIGIIGMLFGFAAWQADPQQAGGTGEAFSWLSNQAYGQALVFGICLGLVGFAIFCFVNAAYRVVPKVSDPGIQTLAAKLMR